MQLQVTIKSNYGQEAIYPANDEARAFCRLMGKKTLSRADLKTIVGELHYSLDVVQPVLNLEV